MPVMDSICLPCSLVPPENFAVDLSEFPVQGIDEVAIFPVSVLDFCTELPETVS